MKRLFIYLISGILLLGIGGCSDFLEESSQDEVRPGTIDDLNQLLLGEGYIRTKSLLPYLELLTDNVQNNYTPNQQQDHLMHEGGPAFSWSPDMFEKMGEKGVLGIDTWEFLYSKIKGCNVVMDMLEKVFGEESDKLNLKGQALALRGFYYFLLVNTFAEPYMKEGIDVEQALGVPLILASAVKDDFPPRERLAKVYRQIEEDLLEAAGLMDLYGQDNVKYKVTPLFVYNLLSRMYLYMGDWKKAAEYASIVIERNPRLMDLNNYLELDEWWGTVTLMSNVYVYESPEFIWGYGDVGTATQFYEVPDIMTYEGSLPVFCVSDELVDIYDDNDLRSKFFYQEYMKIMDFFNPVKGKLHGAKWNTMETDSRQVSRGMRVAEAYLNRAEANIRLAKETGTTALEKEALADLNYLRRHRFAAPYTDVEMDEVPDLLEFCLTERRKELSFEDHRWFDLRRCGMPELVHTYTLTPGIPQTVTLPQGSNRYTLPIPLKVLEKNPALIQNPG